MANGKYIHILWQTPQMLLLTAAEVMFVVPLMEFSYSQVRHNIMSYNMINRQTVLSIDN